MQFPYFAPSPAAEAFVSAAYEGHWVRPEIAWSNWAASEQYEQLRTQPEAIKSASVDEIAHLLTTLIRGDRFNEGLLAAACEEGLLHRVLARVTVLAGGEISRAGDVVGA